LIKEARKAREAREARKAREARDAREAREAREMTDAKEAEGDGCKGGKRGNYVEGRKGTGQQRAHGPTPKAYL
jgi:septal ring factor EnvC (AmiA/AmiB activator)